MSRKRTFTVQMLELVSTEYEVEATSPSAAEAMVEELHADPDTRSNNVEIGYWQMLARPKAVRQ